MQGLLTARPLKNAIILATALTAASALTGCYSPGERALGGAALGGLGGAGIGALASGGSAVGTLGGAAVGAAAGGLLGAATAPTPRRRHYYY